MSNEYLYSRLTEEQRKLYDEGAWAELEFESFEWSHDYRQALWSSLCDRGTVYDNVISCRVDGETAAALDWLSASVNDLSSSAAARLALVVGLEVLLSVKELIPGVYGIAVRNTDPTPDMSAARLASMVCPMCYHRLETPRRK